MTVIITGYAWESLQRIYEYYAEVAPNKVDEFLQELLERIKQLESFPLSGPIEPFYAKCGFNYRFLVHRHYKIIYKVENETIYVMRFFDARQSPEKIQTSEG